MHIRVRTVDSRGFTSDLQLDSLSKLTKVEDVRKLLETHFKIEPLQQRLIFRGKQMEDGQTLFDYSVNMNDIIQLSVKPKQPVISDSNKQSGEDKENKTANGSDHPTSTICKPNANDGPEVSQSQYYKINDRIDAWDVDSGCWFQAKLIKITKQLSNLELNNNVNALELFDESGNVLKEADDGYLYHIYFDGFEDGDLCKLKFNAIRPCSFKKLALKDITVGDVILVNYYIEEPGKRGFWYDATVTKISLMSKLKKELVVTIHISSTQVPLENCKIKFIDEIFRIEKPTKVSKRDLDLEYTMQKAVILKREIRPDCLYCKDRKSVKCKYCCCRVCGGKNDPNKQILCDDCNGAYHIWCLKTPLESLPEDEDWYCEHCKNDDTKVVKAGEKPKQSKKRAKMASTLNKSGRDWGKGMACARRTKECTIVPAHFQGAIPGVEVGSQWIFRVDASGAGVHRPHVSGIAGTVKFGACSIVLAGGYEDDKDDGDTFLYTGSGGRDLSGNKRTAKQSWDQELTRMNKNLAMNCNAKLNAIKGAEAVNWKDGKPVRVIRSSKLKKHSKYAPNKGIRYDGLYKVVKYWPEVGRSGFKVWRYLLKRDDPVPAPWTKQGKKRIEDLGVGFQNPELNENNHVKGKGKRVLQEKDNNTGSPKRIKKSNYKLSVEIKKLIEEDKQNITLWNECLQQISEGQQKFVSKVEEFFMCVCCQDLVCKPVTTVCCHNVCRACLTRSFKSEMYNCPTCRFVLGEKYSMKVNKTLDGILCGLFPGYTVGR